MLRQWLADLTDTTPESPWWRKTLIDTAAQLTSQLATYPLMLYLSGASPEERRQALVKGVIMGLAAGRAYGGFQDGWRSYWGGAKPTLSK